MSPNEMTADPPRMTAHDDSLHATVWSSKHRENKPIQSCYGRAPGQWIANRCLTTVCPRALTDDGPARLATEIVSDRARLFRNGPGLRRRLRDQRAAQEQPQTAARRGMFAALDPLFFRAQLLGDPPMHCRQRELAQACPRPPACRVSGFGAAVEATVVGVQ